MEVLDQLFTTMLVGHDMCKGVFSPNLSDEQYVGDIQITNFADESGRLSSGQCTPTK